MGSPLGLLVVNVFMCLIEENLEQQGQLLRYYRRYADDSLTVMPDRITAGQFLDTLNSTLDTVTCRRSTEIHVDVYRKPTHTDCYLDFFSCHPLCHKRSVVNTLLKRANNIPSMNKGRREEIQQVKAVLRDNNYPMSFIRNCERALTKQPAENNFNGFVVLPYVQGVSEKIGCILKQQMVKVAYKPQQTINSLVLHPKGLDDSDRQKSGIV